MNNNKRFIENSILMTVFAVIVYYVLTFLYSFFKEIDIHMPDLDFNVSIPTVDTNILLDKYIITKNNEVNITKKDIIKTKNTAIKKIQTNDINLSDVNTSVITKKKTIEKKVIKKQIAKKISINKKIIIKKEELKKEIKQTKTKAIVKKETKKEIKKPIKKDKKIMLDTLSKYIKNSIIATRNNANILKNLQKNKSSVKIRITVLDDGSQQNIKYLSGNKELMKEAKMAVKKTFPRHMNQIIKTQFPRYLRFKIEFKGE